MSVIKRLKLKWPYLVMHIFLLIAGIIVLIAPSITVSITVTQLLAHVWAYFFIAGGALSLFGLIRGALWGEAVGLPMAASATLMYGIIIAERFINHNSGIGALIVGTLFVAYSFGLVGRWTEVMQMLRISRRIE